MTYKSESSGTFKDHIFTVWNLDVLGHGPAEHDEYDCDGECDGYQVNDRCRCGIITIKAEGTKYNVGTEHEFVSFSPNDQTIIDTLVTCGFLNPGHEFEVDDAGEDNYYVCAMDGCPLFELERIIES